MNNEFSDGRNVGSLLCWDVCYCLSCLCGIQTILEGLLKGDHYGSNA